MKKTLVFAYYFLIFILSGLLSVFLNSFQSAPSWINSCFVTILMIYFIFFFPLEYLKIGIKKDLKSLSLEELKKQVFRYEKAYFIMINEEDAAVLRFRDLISREDLNALAKAWSSLEKRFRRLEYLAGHKGRPLVLDYYCWYELDLRELKRRLKKLN